MSKLEALIQELCPNGVEYLKIEEICDISRGVVMSKDFIRDNPGDFPVYSSQTENNGELGKIDTYMYDGEYLTWTTDGAHAGSVFYRIGKFSVTNVCGLLHIKKENISARFVYHYLLTVAKNYVNKGMGNAKLMSNVMGTIPVPIPPIEVQREIVQILDKFTLLTAELTAELTARKQQYEHYRDSLLSFNSEIKNLPLNDIMISIKDGSHNPPKDAGYATNLPMISAQNINNGIIDFTNVRFLTDSDFTLEHKRTNIQRNDVLLTIVGAVGRVAVVNTDKKFTCQRSVCILKPNCELIDSEYLKFILESSNIQNYFINNANGAAQKGIYLNQIKNIMIPVPSLEIQKRLVKVLNNFDKICSDLGIGLPAEIEARQQQYEYYRSKLLTMVAEVVNFKASKQASKQAS